MLDTIRRALRHPILDADFRTGEYALPVAKFRPLRDYAPDGSYVQEFQAVFDVTRHGGAAATYSLNTVVSGPSLGAVIPINAIIFQGELIVLTGFTGGTSISIGTSAGSAADSLLTAAAGAEANIATAGLVLPLVMTYAGAGERVMSAEGQITVTTLGTHTAGRAMIRGKYAVLG